MCFKGCTQNFAKVLNFGKVLGKVDYLETLPSIISFFLNRTS